MTSILSLYLINSHLQYTNYIIDVKDQNRVKVTENKQSKHFLKNEDVSSVLLVLLRLGSR